MKTYLFNWFIPLAILFSGYYPENPRKASEPVKITFKRVKSSKANPKALALFKKKRPEIYKALKPQGSTIYSGEKYALLKSEHMTLIIGMGSLNEKEDNNSITLTVNYVKELSDIGCLVHAVCRCSTSDPDCALTRLGKCVSVLNTCSDCERKIEYFGLQRYYDLST